MISQTMSLYNEMSLRFLSLANRMLYCMSITLQPRVPRHADTATRRRAALRRDTTRKDTVHVLCWRS